MPPDDAVAILMDSIYRRTGAGAHDLAAIRAEIRALARGYAASRLRAAAGEWEDDPSVRAQPFADWLTERAAQEERG